METLDELRRGTAATSWSVRDCLYRIIQALLRYLNLFALLLSRLFFFEFPNNLRHLCTTMPWSIWPALVVLWGVCWMFYESADGRTASHGRFIFVHIPFESLTMERTRDAAAGVPVPSRPSDGSCLAGVLLRSSDAPAYRGSRTRQRHRLERSSGLSDTYAFSYARLVSGAAGVVWGWFLLKRTYLGRNLAFGVTGDEPVWQIHVRFRCYASDTTA